MDVRGKEISVRILAGVIVCMAALSWSCRSAPGVETREEFDFRPLASRVGDPELVRRIEGVALTLLAVDAWTEERVLRQRVRIEWGGGSESFDAVLQRRPGELSLIGLGPMNLVGFRLALLASGEQQAGPEKVEFENPSGQALPFTPTHMLADVQRVFYPWLLGVPDCRDCERSGRRGSVAVWEKLGERQLEERRFGIVGALDQGSVRVRYSDWQGDPEMPRHVELENAWFGYRITIDTLESLAADDPTSP